MADASAGFATELEFAAVGEVVAGGVVFGVVAGIVFAGAGALVTALGEASGLSPDERAHAGDTAVSSAANKRTGVRFEGAFQVVRHGILLVDG